MNEKERGIRMMRGLKRTAVCLLVIVLMMCLTACGGEKKDVDIQALAADLASSSAFTVDMSQYAVADGVAENVYMFQEGDVTECVLYYDGSTGEEIMAAKTKDKDAADRVAELCRTRVQNQIAVLQSYVPEAVPRLENAIVQAEGSTVIFVVAEDTAAAQAVVDQYVK